MLSRFKVWTYLAVLLGGALTIGGCGGYSLALDSWPRIITAILTRSLIF